MRSMRFVLFLLVTFGAVGSSSGQTLINFEQFTGPSVFTGVEPPLTVGNATFSGGQLLRGTTALPANGSTVYGTAFFCAGCLPTLTIDFAQGVSNFSVSVMNGQTFFVTYTVEDDTGGAQTATLFANFDSGAGTFTLPSTNIRKVTIRGSTPEWDFFIDDIRFFGSELELVAGTSDGPTAAGTETTPVTDIVKTARFPLGSFFFIQLTQTQEGNKVPVQSSFNLEPSSINPPLTGPSLFASNVVIPLGEATGDIRFFQAIHLGEVILDITPSDSSIQPVKVRIRVNQPLRLGNTNNQFDGTLVDLGNRRGIPPHMLKGQVRQESNFRPSAYRYEPLSVDLNYISRAQNLRTEPPYSLYRLATDDGLAQGTNILAADISPRSIYSIRRNGVIRAINDADQFVSALEIYQLNDAANNWSRFSPARDRAVQGNPNLLNFTAQTPLAASFGLLQILYSTAHRPMGWEGVNGARNPSFLFDTPENLAAGGGSLELASGYLRRVFSRANPNTPLDNPVFDSRASFEQAFQRTFNVYNGPVNGPYGGAVLNHSRSFLPVASTGIF